MKLRLSILLASFIILSSVGYGQNVAVDRLKADTVASRFSPYVYVKDTLRLQVILWTDSTATPGCPPAGSAYIWYAGNNMILAKYPDCSLDTLGNGGGGGGGGGSYGQAGRDTVLSTTTAIALSPALINYIVLYDVVNYGGEGQGATISNQLTSGFDVTPMEDGIMEWVAIPIGGNTIAGSTAVTTSGTAINFTPSVASYIVQFRCVNVSGEGVGVSLSGQTSSQFTATPIEDGTLYWAVHPL